VARITSWPTMATETNILISTPVCNEEEERVFPFFRVPLVVSRLGCGVVEAAGRERRHLFFVI
jgi:hypothetical protein